MISDAIAVVAREFGVSHADLAGERGTAELSSARQVAMWLARTGVHAASFERIGRALGHRDHSTVLFGVRKIEDMRRADLLMAQALERLLAEMRERAASRDPDVAAWRSLGGGQVAA